MPTGTEQYTVVQLVLVAVAIIVTGSGCDTHNVGYGLPWLSFFSHSEDTELDSQIALVVMSLHPSPKLWDLEIRRLSILDPREATNCLLFTIRYLYYLQY